MPLLRIHLDSDPTTARRLRLKWELLHPGSAGDRERGTKFDAPGR